MHLSATDYCHVSFALELIMLRTGILYTPDCKWSRAVAERLLHRHVTVIHLSSVCTSMLYIYSMLVLTV